MVKVPDQFRYKLNDHYQFHPDMLTALLEGKPYIDPYSDQTLTTAERVGSISNYLTELHKEYIEYDSIVMAFIRFRNLIDRY